MITATRPQKLTLDIKAHIMESIYEALNDTDRGLELTDEFKKRLQASKRSKASRISFAEIKRKYC